MKKNTYKTSSKEDLLKEIATTEKTIRDLRFSVQGVTNKNTKAYRDARRSLARAKTAMRAMVD